MFRNERTPKDGKHSPPLSFSFLVTLECVNVGKVWMFSAFSQQIKNEEGARREGELVSFFLY